MTNKLIRGYVLLGLLFVPSKILYGQTPYSLKVSFQGLIAFAPAKVNQQPVLWALLVNADYVLKTATAADLPPCVGDIGIPPISDLEKNFPPHVAAMRIRNAKTSLNGVPITGLLTAISLRGQELQFETGKKIAAASPFPLLAGADKVAGARGGSPADFQALDKVKADFLVPDPGQALKLRDLAARVKVDFGDTMSAVPLTCAGVVKYGFQRPQQGPSDCKGVVDLAEEVDVIQNGLTAPFTITLQPSGNKLTIEPDTPGNTVLVEIMNVMPKAIADLQYNPCGDLHLHEGSFRWYYRFLATSTADCSDHVFPCEATASQGGTKCPLKSLSE